MNVLAGFTLILQVLLPSAYGWVGIVLIVLLAVRGLQQLSTVKRWITEERRILTEYRGVVQNVPGESRIITSVLSRLHETQHPASVTVRASHALLALCQVAHPDLVAVQAVIYDREEGRLSIARTTPNLLLLAGLFGTVLGLAGMVSSLGPQIAGTLQTADPLTLTKNLAVTLEHMRNAFACTLWGILAAIVLAQQVRHVSDMQETLLQDIQHFITIELASLLLPRAQEAQLSDIRAILQQSHDFLAQVTGMMEQAATKFSTVLSDAGTVLQMSMTELHQMTGGMQQALVLVSGEVQSSAETLAHSAAEVNASTVALQQYHQDLRNAYAELSTLFYKSQERIQTLADQQLAKITDLQREYSSTSEEIIAQLLQNALDLQEATRTLIAAREAYQTAHSATLGEVHRGFQQMQEGINTTLYEHRQQMGHVDDGVRLVADRLAKLAERLDPRAVPPGEWRTMCEMLQNLITELQRQDAGHVVSHGDDGLQWGGLKSGALLSGMPPEQMQPVFYQALSGAGASVHDTLALQQDIKAIRLAVSAIEQTLSPDCSWPQRFIQALHPRRWFRGGRHDSTV